MQGNDLEFYTSKELVEELLRRSSFLGVVVHSDTDFRNGVWGDERNFKVEFNSNLSTSEAARLLETVAERIQLYHG